MPVIRQCVAGSLVEKSLHRVACFRVLSRCNVGRRDKAKRVRTTPHPECVLIVDECRDRVDVATGREVGHAKKRPVPERLPLCRLGVEAHGRLHGIDGFLAAPRPVQEIAQHRVSICIARLDADCLSCGGDGLVVLMLFQVGKAK